MKCQILPRFYFYRKNAGGKVESDRRFILQRFSVLPESKKLVIRREYEKIFRAGKPESRRQANEYLHHEAKKYRKNNG